jgi:hypothetical protein
MLFKCKKISEPYFGPHSDVEIVTYFLYNSKNEEFKWHQGPNKPLDCKVGDVLDGIVIRNKDEKSFKPGIINYKKSNPVVVDIQDMMKL